MTVTLAEGNLLRYNDAGGVIVRQSDLSAWSRCNLQKHYYDEANANPDAPQPRTLSATVYGTVVHYVLLLMEQMHHEGAENVLETALSTFEKYWRPENLTQVPGAAPIDEWLPRQTYGGLRARGQVAITDYYNLLVKSSSRLLALEYQFAVPVDVRGRVHTLTGTIDRLSIDKHYTKPYLAIEDFKTGKQPTWLRYNMQGTAYAYASTRPEFWLGWPDSGMGELATFPEETVESLQASFASYDYDLMPGERTLASRRFRWINLQEMKFADGGWRTERDYARLQLAIDAYVRANEAGIYSVNTTGEVCRYCPFRTVCGGTGLPHEKAGAP